MALPHRCYVKNRFGRPVESPVGHNKEGGFNRGSITLSRPRAFARYTFDFNTLLRYLNTSENVILQSSTTEIKAGLCIVRHAAHAKSVNSLSISLQSHSKPYLFVHVVTSSLWGVVEASARHPAYPEGRGI